MQGATATHPVPAAALDADIAILGKKGRGKTYTAKGIVERLLDDGRRVLVLDPLSTWWGLKARADGSEGYPVVVFGGPHADVQLDDGMGRGLGRFLASESVSAVIDLGMMRKAEQARIVGDVLEELFSKNRDPLWLVLEEADAFAPQQPMGDHNMRVLGEVDRIARRGRAFGFRLISISQRAAKLHKDVLTQLSTLIALGVTSPQDRDAVKAWVEGNADREQAKEVMNSMASLKVGEGWVWAPDHDLLKRVKFPAIKTLDTSSTPKVGEKRVEPKRLAQADLSRIEEALKKASEPAAPKKAAAVKTLPSPPDPSVIAAAELRGYERGRAEGQRDVKRLIEKLKGDVREAAVQFARELETAIAGAVPSLPTAPTPPRQVAATPPTLAIPNDGLPPAKQRILDAIAWFNVIGELTPDRAMVAFKAGVSSQSSGFANNLGALRTAGLIDYPSGGCLALTDAGRSAANHPARPGSNADLHAEIKALLTPALWRILEALIDIYPNDASREEIAGIAGVSVNSSGYANNLGRLRSLKLIDYPSQGRLRAEDRLFIK